MNLMCIWGTNYGIYAPFYPSVYSLASFLACLATQFVISLRVYSFYAFSACQLWMNFNVIFYWIHGYYVMHLSFSLLVIYFLFGLWMYSLLSPNFTTKKPFKNPKNLVLFDWIFEIMLACFFVVWKQFLA